MTELARGKQRCYLVYAVAPDGVSARKANELLNEYVEDRRRGFVIFHDHFTGKPHGGVAVFDIRDRAAYRLLEDRGPLAGWEVAVHPLTFSLAATVRGADGADRRGVRRQAFAGAARERAGRSPLLVAAA